MAVAAISREDAIDAEFETISPASLRVNIPRQLSANAGPADIPAVGGQLDLLRKSAGDHAQGEHPNGLTPQFILFTLIAAFVVFWVSGGHVLLY